MEQVFLELVNRSIAAGWLILAVAVWRLIFRRASGRLRLALWGLTAVRLICPFSVKSVFSLVPSAQTIPPNLGEMEVPAVDSGISSLSEAVNPVLAQQFMPEAGASVNPLQVILYLAAWLWILGICALTAYSLLSWLALRLRLRDAVRWPDGAAGGEEAGSVVRSGSDESGGAECGSGTGAGRTVWDGRPAAGGTACGCRLKAGNAACSAAVYQSEKVSGPFVLGVFRPRIYVPFSESDLRYALAHEEEHIHHRDPAIKLFGWCLVILYWFCPPVWLAWALFDRDLELACDERATKGMDRKERIAYAQALLWSSGKKGKRPFCPVAFGAGAVKERVKNVLNGKKPAVFVTLGALAAAVAAAFCFLFDPQPKIVLPEAEEVINAAAERIEAGKSGGLAVFSEKTEIEALLQAMEGGSRTNRIPGSGEPAWNTTDDNGYYIITVNQENGERRKLYLYTKGGRCFLEVPGDGIYRVTAEGRERISDLYEQSDPVGYYYILRRFDADGLEEAGTSPLAGEKAEALQRVVMGCMASSTLSRSQGIAGKEYYRIEVHYEDGSCTPFYVYRQDEKTMVQTDLGGEGEVLGVKLDGSLYEEIQKLLE